MKQVAVALISAFPEGGKKKVTVNGKDVLLIRFEGSFYAVNNACPHMGASLYDGKLEGQYITCPRHGSVFDVQSGAVHQSGKLLGFKVNPHELTRYPVHIEGDELFIAMD